MAMLLQVTTFLNQYLYSSAHAIPNEKKQPNALRIGVISGAMINAAAIYHPVETHQDSVLYAIASRDIKTAKSEAKKYNIQKAYGSYEELLADPQVQAVYISVPNGLHAEWAKKSLEAGKHVLLEKPFTANTTEAVEIARLAQSLDLVLLEAFHWQFHPAAHLLHSLLTSGKYGSITRTHSRMTTPAGTIPGSDIRWKSDLAGGALMDMTYVISSTRFFTDSGAITDVVSAKARPYSKDPKVDEAMEAELRTENGVKCTVYADMNRANVAYLVPRLWEMPSIEIETDKAVIYFYNFMMPHIYHYITITEKATNKTSTWKQYGPRASAGIKGEPWWSTYRYQLEAFVDKIHGREPSHWVTHDSSIAQMETIDAIYEKSGLGRRHGSLA